MKMPLLTYIKEISPRPVLIIAGEKAHSRYFNEDAYKAAAEPMELVIIPNAVHVDLYDKLDVIQFDKLDKFFKDNLKFDSLTKQVRDKQTKNTKELAAALGTGNRYRGTVQFNQLDQTNGNYTSRISTIRQGT